MDRYIPYIKIAVCTQNPGVNDTIREYAAGFEVRAGVKIQVDIMKNCYPLAKKILDREHYDVICLGRKLWDIDSYTFASSIRMTDQETIFLLLGWDRLTLPQIEKVAPVAYLHTPLQKEEFRKELYRVLSRLGPGRRYLSIHTPGYKKPYAVSGHYLYLQERKYRAAAYPERRVPCTGNDGRNRRGTDRNTGTLPESTQKLPGEPPLYFLDVSAGSRPDGRNPHPGQPDLQETNRTGLC